MTEVALANSRALNLELLGDLPSSEFVPPDNVLFVAKLNRVTEDEDLEIIFSKYGKVVKAEVIRDRITGESLQYAFIEFDKKSSCEEAWKRAQGAIIDDSRIFVDFSQSVGDMWKKAFGKGKGKGGKGAAGGGKEGWSNKKKELFGVKSSSSSTGLSSRPKLTREAIFGKRQERLRAAGTDDARGDTAALGNRHDDREKRARDRSRSPPPRARVSRSRSREGRRRR